MPFTNPADNPLLPFVYKKEPYHGSGPHIMTACFLALDVKVIYTVNRVQFDETLVQDSLHTAPLTDDDLAHEGIFRYLPNGDHDDNYDAKPIIEAAFSLAKHIALIEAERPITETFTSTLATALARHYNNK